MTITGSLDTPQALGAAIAENANAPFGPARIRRAEDLVDAADRLGHGGGQVWALLELVEAYVMGSEPGKAFVPFARLLTHYDRTPGDFDSSDVRNLHWEFKWMTSGMLSHPEISLDRIQAGIDEMARRYAAAGYGPNAVHLVRFALASRTGRFDEAAQIYDEWLASPRDDMSDCEACEPSKRARWTIDSGDDAAGLALLEPIFAEGLTCGDEPEYALASTLLPLVRLGRVDEARTNHLRGARMMRAGSTRFPLPLAMHLEFCARTGNEARGLELLGRHRIELDQPEDGRADLQVLRAAALLARRVAEAGFGDVPVPVPGGADAPASEAARVLARHATDLAARFDARNGTPYDSQVTAAVIDAQPLSRVDLALPRATLAPDPDPAPAVVAPWGDDGPAPVIDLRDPVEVALDIGLAAWSDGLYHEAAEVFEAVLPDAVAADPTTEAELRWMLAVASVEIGDNAMAVQHAVAAGARSEAADDLLGAGNCAMVAAQGLLRLDNTDGALQALAEAEALFIRGGLLVGAVRARRNRANLLANDDRVDEALAVLDGTASLIDAIEAERAEASPEGADSQAAPPADGSFEQSDDFDPVFERAELDDAAAGILADHGRYDEALACSLAAAAGHERSGALADQAYARNRAGHLCLALDRPTEGEQHIRVAVALVAGVDDPRCQAFHEGFRVGLADLVASQGREAEAAELRQPLSEG